MATYSTGVTVTWNANTFTEVFALSWNYGGARQDRGFGNSQGWSPEPGQVSFSCYGTSGVSVNSHGVLGLFSITGGGMSASGRAVLDSIESSAELNGVTRYNVVLKIHA